jgi:glyoxylase-like metal-dependent hydrolase (beta-lactamase superfamily II)
VEAARDLQAVCLGCLAHASYIIGDEASGTAVVVDPQRDTDQYLAFSGDHGLKIKHVFLTHLHADFVVGHLELRPCGRKHLSRCRG